MPQIVQVSSAFPPYYFTQEEVTKALIAGFGVDESKARVIERLHRSVGVSGRFHSLPFDGYLTLNTFTERNKAWGEMALVLAEKCVNQLLESASAKPSHISQLMFTTVTGLSVPSIDARLMNRIPFNSNLK